MRMPRLGQPGSLDAFWMPFTANRQFKAAAAACSARAEGMHYYTPDGRKVLDSAAGLWCVNAGHCRQADRRGDRTRRRPTLDFAPTFQMGHPLAFELADATGPARAGKPFTQVFFTNSGSEAVDTALKMALAYHRARGEGQRTRLIGRERGYHGVGFGGMSGRRASPATARCLRHACCPASITCRHTHDLAKNAFSRGEPAWGSELADELERIVTLHDRLHDRRGHRRAGGRLAPACCSRRVAICERLREHHVQSTASC
jgi:beta-alanine--pyruvate transaminase